MFIALDVCFRLKRHLISSPEQDPGLGTSWAYFVADAPYQEFALTLKDQDVVCFVIIVDHYN